MTTINEAAELERVLFEHHERESCLTRNTEGSEDDYQNPFVESAWQGWKARASLPPASGEAGGLAAFERLMVDARENMMADPNEIAEILKLGPSYFTKPSAPEMQASHGAAGADGKGE